MSDQLLTFGVRSSELEYQVSRSSGPGGQNVNKVNSKVTLRWNVGASGLDAGVKRRFIERFGSRLTKAGEVLIQSDEFRDQGRNKEACRERLAAMIRAVFRAPKKRRATKPSGASRERRLTGKKQRAKIKSMRGKPPRE